MAKFKKTKNQEKIKQFIYNDFIEGSDITDASELLKHVDMLVDNGLASHISDSCNLTYQTKFSSYRVASKMICDFSKDMKKYNHSPVITDEKDYFYDDDDRIINLSKYNLDIGCYFVDISKKSKSNYAIMKVKKLSTDNDDRENTTIIFDLYFIGKQHLKFKDKYFKLIDKYKKIVEDTKDEAIISAGPMGNVWKQATFKSFDRMVFTNKEEIIKYIENWMKSIPIYFEYEMTPKLSILLYGEPGTGKSTFCKALAKYLKLDTVVSLSPAYFVDNPEMDSRYRNSLRVQGVYAIDDIDCVCKSREDDDSNENASTLSNLLEFLDNPNTFYFKSPSDGKHYPVSIVVATTNYYDKLDAAVKRYGRFDLQIEMKPFNRKQANEMCSLYGLKLENIYKGPIEKDFTISPAYLQSLCMENIDNNVKNVNE